MKLGRTIILATVILLSILLYVTNTQVGVTQGQRTGLVAKFVDKPLPLTDPEAELWGDVEAVEVALGPQLTATPWVHPEPSVRAVKVRVVHNGTWVSFLLEWDDETKDDVMRTDSFRDAVAIMLALQPGAGQCMGTPSAEVVIAHWKADWQRDVDIAFTDVDDIYPNFWSDWYPMMITGKAPYKTEEIFNNTRIKEFLPGWAVENLLSNPYKLNPVETLVAHGWGTLTTLDYQDFIARGVHDGKGWKVVISRPVATGNKDPPWQNGEAVEVAFAVWDGSNGEIGAKKGVSLPLTLSLEKPRGVAAGVTTVTVTEEVVGAPVPTALPLELLVVLILLVIGIVLFIIGVVIPSRRRRKEEERR